MKIIHLKYKEIDFDKYNNCVENAYNTRIYAYSWYLDIVANKNWEVLVLGDYQAVMPLPFKRVKSKLLKKMIVQPLFCQQLGVFSLTELLGNTLQNFIIEFKKFNIYTYNFNANNTSFIENEQALIKKNNFELHLKQEYFDIKKNYNKGLKSNINKSKKSGLAIKKGLDFSKFRKMKIENSFHKIKETDFKKMEALTQKIIHNSKGNFYAVYKESELVSISFFIKTQKRIIYLLSSANAIGKKTGATSFLLNSMIKKNSEKDMIFDFEGAMIDGLAKFFKSFGAKNNEYLEYNNL